jgi:hypothetical protein
MTSFFRSLAVGGILLVGSWSAEASVIYSDLGPDGSYTNSLGLIVGQPAGWSQAAEFVNGTGARADVTQIDLGLTHSIGTNGAVASLWSANGNTLGTELASWNLSNQPDNATATNTLTSITNISGLLLQPGASYFLEVSPAASDTLDSWNLNNRSAATLIVSTSPTSGTVSSMGAAPAFDIQGTVPPVPLPASGWLLLTGLGALGLGRRRVR